MDLHSSPWHVMDALEDVDSQSGQLSQNSSYQNKISLSGEHCDGCTPMSIHAPSTFIGQKKLIFISPFV